MLTKKISHYSIFDIIPIKSVKIIKEIKVVVKIALTITLGLTSYAEQSANENAPHGPSDTRNVPRKSAG